jgi:hypothetical protein
MSLITPPGVKNSPEIRVLFCLVCKTFQELPLYNGPVEKDVLLDILVERHIFPSGEPHKGHLFRVPKMAWENESTRKQIVNQILGGGSKGLDEFDKEFYATKDTFKEDAMVCYQKHLRPDNGCPDWMSDKKILLPNTKAERKDAGLPDPKSAPGPKNYLCQFCPVQSTVMQKARAKRGDYND